MHSFVPSTCRPASMLLLLSMLCFGYSAHAYSNDVPNYNFEAPQLALNTNASIVAPHWSSSMPSDIALINDEGALFSSACIGCGNQYQHVSLALGASASLQSEPAIGLEIGAEYFLEWYMVLYPGEVRWSLLFSGQNIFNITLNFTTPTFLVIQTPFVADATSYSVGVEFDCHEDSGCDVALDSFGKFQLITPAVPASCPNIVPVARAPGYCDLSTTWWRDLTPGQADWTPVQVEGDYTLVLRRHVGVYSFDSVGGIHWMIDNPTVEGGIAVSGTLAVFASKDTLYIVGVADKHVVHEVPLQPFFGHANARGAPVIDGDNIYIVQAAGLVSCISLSYGTINWTRNLGLSSGSYAPVALYGAFVVIGTFDGRIVKLHSDTGAIESEYSAPGFPLFTPGGAIGGIQSGVLVVGDYAFFSTSQADSNFLKVDLRTMSLLGALTPASGFFAFTTPTLYNNTIYTTTSNGQLHAICPGVFTVNWTWTGGSRLRTSGPLAIANDIVVLAFDYGFVYEIDVRTHTTIRDRYFSATYGTIATQPSWSGNTVALAGGLKMGSLTISCEYCNPTCASHSAPVPI